jgi:hypothetical protein
MKAWLAAAFLAAAGLRAAGLDYGLPHVFNADEPHVVNLSVSLGGGLKPYSFKYPTLWPTILFGAYGAYYLVWSGLGLRASVGEFSALFGWEPGGFYLIARALSALLSLAALGFVAAAQRELRPGRRPPATPWAALLLAFAPAVVVHAHAAKPDSALLFFIAAAWLFALKVYREGEPRWYRLCGAALGLALSCQYTAGAAWLALLLAHAARSPRPPLRRLGEGLAWAGACFIAGSPYILLDFSRFWADLGDFSYLAQTPEAGAAGVLEAVLINVWSFAGDGSLAGPALVLGAALAARREPRLAALLLVPVAAYVAVLGRHPDGAWLRYLFGCFPALALLASAGLEALAGAGRAARAAVLAAAILPGAYASLAYDRELLLPDTRTIAGEWIAREIPRGAALLMDSIHASPPVASSYKHLQALAARSRAADSPRARLYEAMLAAHPGGGYEVYRLKRTALDLRSNPRHVERAQADQATLDVSEGLAAARRAGVEWVVTSSHGADPRRARELAGFFAELAREGTIVREFLPEPGLTTGPVLRIYRL